MYVCMYHDIFAHLHMRETLSGCSRPVPVIRAALRSGRSAEQDEMTMVGSSPPMKRKRTSLRLNIVKRRRHMIT